VGDLDGLDQRPAGMVQDKVMAEAEAMEVVKVRCRCGCQVGA